jgi:hypothetical protein
MESRETSAGRRPRYTPSKAVRLHRRQLFHWIGSDLVEKGKLTDEIRQKYVTYLKKSLEQGLWLKCPRQKDRLVHGNQIEVTQPICCFTETSLDEIADHSQNYGQLGLGFPKRFVLERGGRPVNYLHDKKTDPSVQAWKRLVETFEKPAVLNSLSEKERHEVKESLSFVSHFLKAMNVAPQKRAAPSRRAKTKKTERRAKPVVNSQQRSFGGPLHFLEEREWRFVVREMRNRIVPKGAQMNPEYNDSCEPPWFMPYTPGKDLFTVVFPDNVTLSMAMEDEFVRPQLFQRDRPHVTVLSLDDLGTF